MPRKVCCDGLESLAVAWAVGKCHHFLYATHCLLGTDQKPLEAMLSKSLNQATPRLQEYLQEHLHTILQ